MNRRIAWTSRVALYGVPLVVLAIASAASWWEWNRERQEIETQQDLARAMDQHKSGDAVTVTVIRGKRKMDVKVTLGEAQQQAAVLQHPEEPNSSATREPYRASSLMAR